ncbi:class I SAM-dependent methyltransferase [Mangrovimonas sp. YM274]|uniref:class I SAM-dependent methyltransferase n=1 Tax=Mangrovimonas sp. YM274 TaxID=3070660 RepID=UPI0027DBC1A1|nr:class I SAM-dependent methyltransferase [Mangrovimonas sp. YM274]WMI69208.1 class I SAM-dependent methyltransferase [Mangrovimonas sp. YM274]
MNHLKSHWDNVYDTKTDPELGWYEPHPETTLQLIDKCNLQPNASILAVGAGTSNLIDTLVAKGFQNLIANDLSRVALDKLKARIKEVFNHDLNCVVDDLTQPKVLQELAPIDLWVDRAVLHFFLKEEEQTAYFDLIKKVVAKDGYALIAVFALNGAEKCCGLPLQRYNTDMLQDKLGDEFQLLESMDYTFINPFGGERPYVYTLFKRV